MNKNDKEKELKIKSDHSKEVVLRNGLLNDMMAMDMKIEE